MGQYLREMCANLKHREVVRELCNNPTITAVFPIIVRTLGKDTANVERTFTAQTDKDT